MAHQHGTKVILFKNLIERMEQSSTTGKFSLKGTITREEYNAMNEAFVCLKNVNLGVLVERVSIPGTEK